MGSTRLKSLRPALKVLGAGHARPEGVPGWLVTQRGSRHERGYGAAWERAVKRIRARDRDVCQECLRSGALPVGSYSAVDHKVPKFEGGSDDDSNLEVICKPHHDAKTARESARARGLGMPQDGAPG